MTDSLTDYFLVELATSQGRFVPVAGLRTQYVRLQAEPFERLGFALAGWRHLQPHPASQFMELAGSGLFTDAAAQHLVQRLFADGRHTTARIHVPGVAHFEGRFAITELTFESQIDALTNWRLALQSAGEVDFALA